MYIQLGEFVIRVAYLMNCQGCASAVLNLTPKRSFQSFRRKRKKKKGEATKSERANEDAAANATTLLSSAFNAALAAAVLLPLLSLLSNVFQHLN